MSGILKEELASVPVSISLFVVVLERGGEGRGEHTHPIAPWHPRSSSPNPASFAWETWLLHRLHQRSLTLLGARRVDVRVER
jgi:hypothetical protein